MADIGQQALISLISHILFISLTWKVVVSLNFDAILVKGKSTEGRVLLLFLTIVIGAGVSRFFLEILQWSQDLLYLF
ncbi:DUF1146 family protein [Virgibacillus xinjiangensis]|uniref:DUF1146 family protein n=1 Tax=Virgibacillus xinjiangensis TaxID=393090 RepID=A0ABV7CSJ0_9BACI